MIAAKCPTRVVALIGSSVVFLLASFGASADMEYSIYRIYQLQAGTTIFFYDLRTYEIITLEDNLASGAIRVGSHTFVVDSYNDGSPRPPVEFSWVSFDLIGPFFDRPEFEEFDLELGEWTVSNGEIAEEFQRATIFAAKISPGGSESICHCEIRYLGIPTSIEGFFSESGLSISGNFAWSYSNRYEPEFEIVAAPVPLPATMVFMAPAMALLVTRLRGQVHAM